MWFSLIEGSEDYILACKCPLQVGQINKINDKTQYKFLDIDKMCNIIICGVYIIRRKIIIYFYSQFPFWIFTADKFLA